VEQVKSYFYITGLTGEVRKEVEAKMNFRQHSYAEIMEYALATDARLRAASYSMKVHQSGPAASSTSTNNSGARHHRNEPTPMEIGSVKAQQSSNVSKGSQLKQDVKCHHCKKVGHIRRNCPDLKAEVK
jgi:Zinc knuckle